VAAVAAAVATGRTRGARAPGDHVVGGAPARAGPAAAAPTTGAGRALPTSVDVLSADDRALLRAVFGIAEPSRLRLSDTGRTAVLLYDAVPPACGAAVRSGAGGACRPATVRVGLASPRRPGETWDAFVVRVRRAGPKAWSAAGRRVLHGLASLDPRARPAFERLVADARRAGFDVRVAETYRSPERQALLFSRGDGRTETATSVHSYGRAADLVVGDGRIDRPETARAWIAFRTWVVRYRGGRFRLVGTPQRTWDWPHVELAAPLLGYRTLPELVGAARDCRAASADAAAAALRCTLRPTLPEHLAARHGRTMQGLAATSPGGAAHGDATAAAGQ
jgi:hypothetical protein